MDKEQRAFCTHRHGITRSEPLEDVLLLCINRKYLSSQLIQLHRDGFGIAENLFDNKCNPSN